jgi:hypothetical protein
VEMKALVPAEPGANLGMLVRGIVVDDQMHLPSGRGFAVDLVEEADELLMPVAAHALADDLAVEQVERGEQRRRAVPLAIVGHRAAAAALDRQPRLGAIERPCSCQGQALDLMGWMAPSVHRRAMLVAVESHRNEEPS